MGLSEIKDVALVLTPIITLYVTAFNIRHSNDIQAATRAAEAAQAWLEKTFIAEGIEPIVHYLSTMVRIVEPKMKPGFVEPPLPMAALTRMTLLFRHDRLLPLVMFLAEEFRRVSEKDNSQDVSDLIQVMTEHQKLTELLLRLEGDLLMCEIGSKKEVLLLHRIPEIGKKSETIKDTFENLFERIAKREGREVPGKPS